MERIRSGRDGRPTFSFEFSPPRDEVGEAQLWRTVRILEQLQPAFVSMTYGAGGSTRDRTVRITGQLATETTLLPVAHLTAVSHSAEQLRSVIGAYADAGIRNVLALRGDPPGDPLGEWQQHPDGLEHASDLVRLVRSLGDFTVGVAAFPEGHHRSPDLDHDARHFVNKLRAGAEYSITQMFFRAEDYLGLRDRVVRLDPEQGEKPIVPGIMPITSLRSVKRMAELSGKEVPPEVVQRLERAAGTGEVEDKDAVRREGVAIAAELSQRLIDEGVPCLHFYTLNFSRATLEVLTELGMVQPKQG
ncbi:methylenetetrahydrofolate reductase [NAD(P)H] [Rhodococcus sp. X156]|uniref:methylenetetrahydrofolate reductase [NAD(P)H] n=1 Tax=Rhodococcus sp. X156 TaxID=2499145 RepID=UPI000FD85378|nr:methylenetetrahydrofolate reductase [NAD(P)H] [Rhodococcus sp. X156]